MSTWKVWGELRRRPHLELVWAYLDGHDGRLEALPGGRRRVVLDARLDQRSRRAVLAHELVHDERSVLYTATTPVALIRKEEGYVERETCRRLVPPVELADYVERLLADGDAVAWPDVAEWFDVPRDIAELALALLADRRAWGARPP
jgi:hypothetical protein